MTKATIHDQDYEYYGWQDLGELSFELSKQIIEKKGSFDRLIALAKSGLTFSRTIRDYLAIPHLSILDVSFYSGINKRNRKPLINQGIPVSVKDERILLYDDIVDTGETLKFAVQYLEFHGVKSVTTASLFTKPWTEVQPDFAAQSTSAWTISPHEVRETIGILTKLWGKKGDSPKQIRQQLVQIGIPESEVALFLDLQ